MSQLEFENEKEKEVVVNYGSQLEQEDPKEPEAPNLEDTKPDEPTTEEMPIIEGDEQLALFEVPEEKKPKTPAKSTTAKKAPPIEKVDSDYMVYYAGHQIAVPNNEMTLEEVRAYLEMDFPELSKDRTSMLLDKDKKQIIPVVKGAKKG